MCFMCDILHSILWAACCLDYGFIRIEYDESAYLDSIEKYQCPFGSPILRHHSSYPMMSG